MPLKKSLRVEHMSSSGVMLTKDEVEKLADSQEESRETLRDIAAVAKAIGREACNRDNCQLDCSFIDLGGAVSKMGADLAIRCAAPDCADQGILAAQEEIISSVTE